MISMFCSFETVPIDFRTVTPETADNGRCLGPKSRPLPSPKMFSIVFNMRIYVIVSGDIDKK